MRLGIQIGDGGAGAVQRFGEAGGGFARGGNQRGARRRLAVQQREQLGNGGGFACARPAANQHKIFQQSKRSGGALVAAHIVGKPIGKQLRQGFFRLHRHMGG